MTEELKPCPFCGETRPHFVPGGYCVKILKAKLDEANANLENERDTRKNELGNGTLIAINNAQAAEIAHLRAELEAVKAERDEAITECRKRKGWDQDIAHWRERAEAAEAELADEQKAHDEIASICFNTGVEACDGTSVDAVRELAKSTLECSVELQQAREALRSIAQSDPVVIDGKQWRMERKDAIDRAASALLDLLKEA